MLMSALQPNSFQSLSFILFHCHAHERPPIRYFRDSSRLSGVVLTRFGVKRDVALLASARLVRVGNTCVVLTRFGVERDVALLASARLVRVGNTFSACPYWLLKTLYPWYSTNPESKSTRGRGAADRYLQMKAPGYFLTLFS
jgi:hypothetical protein